MADEVVYDDKVHAGDTDGITIEPRADRIRPEPGPDGLAYDIDEELEDAPF